MLLMKYQDNFSIREISETFKISESATKMRLLRTKEKMKKLYLEHIALFSLVALKVLLLFKK
jgi:DNA-directed RNA polymerase specialized sigma24 family protein